MALKWNVQINTVGHLYTKQLQKATWKLSGSCESMALKWKVQVYLAIHLSIQQMKEAM